VSGESLRDKLNREKRLALEASIGIAKEVADALGYAHRQGVLHRDIKPENILLSEGHAVVADFGIAKAIMTAGAENLTRSGFPLGTPGYMSPEQAAGQADLDVRTDVYSLACVVYETFVGDPPGMWIPDDVVRLKRFVEAPAHHRELLDLLPGSVEQALVQALALRPESRYANPAQFVEMLELSLAGSPKFDQAQAKQIVARAAELQVAKPTEEDKYSLGGIQQAAAEVGIAPERVDEALEAMNVVSGGLTRGGILGVSPKLEIERFVDCEISATDYAVLLEEIRVSLGEIGDINETLGNALSWSSPRQGTSRKAQVLVSPKGGQTRIRIADNEGGPSGIVMAPITVGSLVLIGVTGAILAEGLGLPDITALIGAVTVSGSFFASTYWAARRSMKREMTKRLNVISGLMDRLAKHVRERGRGSLQAAPNTDGQV
ncbi:protein kinase, partial [Gemmatimonadota bacterium]